MSELTNSVINAHIAETRSMQGYSEGDLRSVIRALVVDIEALRAQDTALPGGATNKATEYCAGNDDLGVQQ